jgi:phosphopantothenoylcysteine decarboxylase/phosphopantothenate--cysteine ligase
MTDTTKRKTLVGLGVTGGIGAYKAVEVARLLQQRGHRVRVVMTRSARKFVGPLTFESITGMPVITSQFAPGMNAGIEHVSFASDIDLLLVAPGTANTIGKFAHGIADDFLSALFLATKAPVLIAPAMNTHMWEHPAVHANVEQLAARGVSFVDPGEGYLACGWIGKGRLAEPEDIAAAADHVLGRGQSLAGRRVVVTAGPTYEDLDPVRFVGNRSSGRMGFALAAEAERRGAEVILIAGPTSVPPPPVGTLVRVRTAAEMHEAVLPAAREADIVVMAAAVADYAPVGGAAPTKLEKGEELMLRLEPTVDILAALGAGRGDAERPVLVGFAAETGDVVERARRKLVEKRVDLVVGNDVSQPDAGFDVDTNRVTLVTAATSEALPLLSKAAVAVAILDRVEDLLARHSEVSAS